MIKKSKLDLWNLLTGKIVDTITLEKAKQILEVVVLGEQISLITSKNNDNQVYISGISCNESKLEQNFSIPFVKCNYYKIMQYNCQVLLIVQLFDSYQIKLGQINYENISNETVFENFLTESKSLLKETSIIDIYITDETKLLVFHFENKLIVLSSMEPYEFLFEIILESNVPTKMFSIKGIDGLVCLNANKNLVVYLLNGKNKTFEISVNEKKFDLFTLKNEFLILNYEFKIMVIKFGADTIYSLKENVIFEKKLHADRVYGQFGISSNFQFIYFTENKRILHFISLSPDGNNSTLEIPMHNQIRSIVCSNTFISMILQNRRVISFLINDLNQKEELRSIVYNFFDLKYFIIFYLFYK